MAIKFQIHFIGIVLFFIQNISISLSREKWYRISNPFDGYAADRIHRVNDNCVYAVGEKGTFFKSVDGGMNWDISLSIGGFSGYLYGVHFISPDTGYAAGDKGTLLYSEDGGNTWDHRNSETEGRIKDIFFVNPDIGFIVSNGQKILKSVDGGITWEECFSGDVNRVYFKDKNTGFALGKDLLRTGDGGKTWHETGLGSFNDIQFILTMVTKSKEERC